MTLVTPVPRPAARHRLVLFPHAGGGPSFYRGWAAAVPEDIEFTVVHYPGREARPAEPPVDDAYTRAAEVADALRATADGRPTALFGHSMGAHLAHETALALGGEVVGVPLSALFVSARRAPATLTPAVLRGAPRARTDEEILDAVRRHGGTPMELFDEPGVRELFLRPLRADYRLVDGYRPLPDRAPLTVPVTALWGERDPSTDAESTAQWRGVTTGAFRSRSFEGGHFYLVDHRAAVLDLVHDQLDAAVGRSPLAVPHRNRDNAPGRR